MPYRILSCIGLALIVACSATTEKARQENQEHLAARCQFQPCECLIEGAARGTPPQPVLWRDDGNPYCAEGQALALSKAPGQAAPAAIMLPDFDDVEDQRRKKNPHGAQ